MTNRILRMLNLTWPGPENLLSGCNHGIWWPPSGQVLRLGRLGGQKMIIINDYWYFSCLILNQCEDSINAIIFAIYIICKLTNPILDITVLKTLYIINEISFCTEIRLHIYNSLCWSVKTDIHICIMVCVKNDPRIKWYTLNRSFWWFRLEMYVEKLN